jgi:hypothetical protein
VIRNPVQSDIIGKGHRPTRIGIFFEEKIIAIMKGHAIVNNDTFLMAVLVETTLCSPIRIIIEGNAFSDNMSTPRTPAAAFAASYIASKSALKPLPHVRHPVMSTARSVSYRSRPSSALSHALQPLKTFPPSRCIFAGIPTPGIKVEAVTGITIDDRITGTHRAVILSVMSETRLEAAPAIMVKHTLLYHIIIPPGISVSFFLICM